MSIVTLTDIVSHHFPWRDKKDVRQMHIGLMEIDSELVISKVHNKFIETILGDTNIQGKKLHAVLRPHLAQEQYRDVIAVLKTLILRRDVISTTIHKNPFDCLKLSIANGQGRSVTKYIRCEFSKSRHYEQTGRWQIVIRDISKSVRISKQIRRSTEKAELKVNTMMSLLQFERDLIKEFLETTTFSLRSIIENLSSKSAQAQPVRQRIENIYCIVHQIKGDAAILNLNAVSDQAHRLENVLSTFNQRKELLQKDLVSLIPSVKEIIVSVKEIKEIFEKIVEGGWNSAHQTADDSMMRRLKHLVERLAQDSGKKVILVDDGYLDTSIPLHLRRVVNTIVTQIARNAVIHGIEDKQTRLTQNKTAYGCLHISVQHGKNKISIGVRDDGRGLNVNAIKQAAIKNPLFEKAEVAKWTSAQTLNALFKPGFSTAKELTQHAGRGVGLDVIKSTVEKHQGNVAIKSVAGLFTEFTMSFPLS
ncbi:Chemotaxis protein CheA [Thalassocella blandensis]|nr:Chemotaxis protein CheA [Thalassocella blandensis]